MLVFVFEALLLISNIMLKNSLTLCGGSGCKE
nr:MAG TPA: hypothetical protein [Caudoviricetes sp.]DAL04721.1 MAG TPA: hypothetical protein [Caudoviricetes sp.]DAN30401.1 MAG TPA: hypothetical protein [Caudoviricetes sp.]DAR22197.1 MAG TPA: hypothetical protein [Caudoviricetes sp.]DAX47580.1 MAG TPA: hypothetical protein [Caudoviricetes sp.]